MYILVVPTHRSSDWFTLSTCTTLRNTEPPILLSILSLPPSVRGRPRLGRSSGSRDDQPKGRTTAERRIFPADRTPGSGPGTQLWVQTTVCEGEDRGTLPVVVLNVSKRVGYGSFGFTVHHCLRREFGSCVHRRTCRNQRSRPGWDMKTSCRHRTVCGVGGCHVYRHSEQTL